jgi:3-hydroxyisobutyrate dehydrogenase
MLRSRASRRAPSSGRSLSSRSSETDTRQRLGFIGLGNLGRHLAASLLHAGFPLTVNDLDEAAARPLLEAGAAWGGSPRDVAAASDSVFTCLPSPGVVADVLLGESGVLEGLAVGGTWIDSSTNDRYELQRLAALAQDRGLHCLEAPVTGGVHLAASGEITVLVGGDVEIYAEHLPAFEAIGGRVFYIGPFGSASVIKVITNMLAFIHLVAAGEALMLARRAGLDLAQSFDVIKASSGTSFVHETESQVILNGSYDIGFTMDLACKDLGFAHELGAELGVPLELGHLVEQIFVRAREEYGGSAWSPMVVKLLEDALGTDLRAPGFPSSITA